MTEDGTINTPVVSNNEIFKLKNNINIKPKTMNTSHDENVKKCFELLNKLEGVLRYTDKIHLSNFVKEFKVKYYSDTVAELVQGGILKNTGGGSTKVRYVWNTIKPNWEMARELCKRAKKRSLQRSEKRIRKLDKKPEPTKTEILLKPEKEVEIQKTPLLRTKTTKYLFGAIKIKTVYEYA